MLAIICKRVLQGILVVFILYTVTFFLTNSLPGSPFDTEAGKDVPEHIRAKQIAKYGLDDPISTRYLRGITGIFQADFGNSPTLAGRPVTSVLKDAFPASLTIGLMSVLFSLAIGIPSGMIAAARKNKSPDFAVMALAMLGICLPSFVIGPILAEFLGAKLNLLPPSGWSHPLSFLLPSLTLSLISAAYISRLTRAGLLEVLHSDWIRTAYAKGLSEKEILIKHALRGALVPVVAYLGPAIAGAVSGSIIVESVFNVPGMGNLFINAINSADSFMINGCVVLYGILLVSGVLFSDLLLLWINPRLRSESN